MSILFKNRHLFVVLSITFLGLGCDENMTYQEFLTRFQHQCPDYHLIKQLAPQKRQVVCDCMLKTTQQNYTDMTSLIAGIRAHDREPRGETDFVPSTIRMAAASCIKSE